MDFNESGKGIVLINLCPLKVDNYYKWILVIQGVAGLDVLLIVNLEYLGKKIYLISFLYMWRSNKNNIRAYFLFFYFPSTILSNILFESLTKMIDTFFKSIYRHMMGFVKIKKKCGKTY